MIISVSMLFECRNVNMCVYVRKKERKRRIDREREGERGIDRER